MPRINRLPISAGITRFMIQMASDVASIPVMLVLKSATSSILAFQRIPISVSNAMLGTMANTRKTKLIDQKVCHQFNSTLKSWKNK